MHARHLAPRQRCNSTNPYDASVALRSVLLSAVTGSPCSRPRYGISSPQDTGARRLWLRRGGQSERSISTTTCVKHESLQSASASEAKVESEANKTPEVSRRPHKPARIRRYYTDEDTSSSFRPRTDQANENARSRRPYSLQAQMQNIAEQAGRFAKLPVKLSDIETIESRTKVLAYDGGYQKPQSSPLEHDIPIPWALDITQLSGASETDILEQEISRFVKYIEPTGVERVAREAVISELLALIADKTGPKIMSEVFGSERTGLAMATSDIDIRLECNMDDRNKRHEHLTTRMKALAAHMIEGQDYILVVPRYHTYPIINAQHKETGIHVQIVGSPDTTAQDAVTLQHLNELPHLRSLYLLLRSALGTRGLVDVFTGGTGSYGLFIMLVASLKRRSSNPPVIMTDQLFQFIDFYSKLNLIDYGVSVSPPKLFKKHNPWDVPIKKFIEAARRRGDFVRSAQWAISQRRLYQPYLLCLQDPAKPQNDLGRKSNAIKHVIHSLDTMGTKLANDMNEAVKAADRGRAWRGESVLLNFVGRLHEVNLERRKKLEEYGRKVMHAKRQTEKEASVARVPQFARAEAG